MSNEFIKPRPGKIFKAETGKLYIFRPSSIEVYKMWPDLRAWKKDIKNPNWRSIRPHIKLPHGDIEKEVNEIINTLADVEPIVDIFDCSSTDLNQQKSHAAFLQWVRCIPEDIRDIVRPFPERHWHLLSFLSACGQKAVNLTKSNPALAFMLASNWLFHTPAVKKPLRSARSLLKKKQRDILPWLGFPPTNQVRNILMKIPHASIHPNALSQLRDMINNPDSKRILKILSHLPRVNTGVIYVLSEKSVYSNLTPESLIEIASNRLEDDIPYCYRIFVNAMKYIRFLNSFGENLTANYTKSQDWNFPKILKEHFLQKAEKQNLEFQDPPVPGDKIIVPITNVCDLKKEGDHQKNCVFNFLPQILTDKNLYAYKVLGNERCTLVLTKYEYDQVWQLHELRAINNTAPGKNTVKIVEKWLNHNGLNIKPKPLLVPVDHFMQNPFDDDPPL